MCALITHLWMCWWGTPEINWAHVCELIGCQCIRCLGTHAWSGGAFVQKRIGHSCRGSLGAHAWADGKNAGLWCYAESSVWTEIGLGITRFALVLALGFSSKAQTAPDWSCLSLWACCSSTYQSSRVMKPYYRSHLCNSFETFALYFENWD